MRTVLAVALLALVVSAGCAGRYRVSEEPPDGVTTDADGVTEAPATTETATRTTATETATGTTAWSYATDDEPRKGDQFLSVARLNESRAVRWNASKRASFGNLSVERQRIVKEAIRCDCNVELRGEFSFYNEDRVEVVEYDGTYYFLRVSIV